MHGSQPLLRTATFAAAAATASSASPASRIPHIAFHILRRRALPQTSRSTYRSAAAHQYRLQSTSANIEDVRSFDLPSNQSVKTVIRPAVRNVTAIDPGSSALTGPTEDEFSTNIEEVNFYTILEKESPDLVLLAFSNPSIGDPFIQFASDELFNKALLLLVPSYLIDRYREISRHLKYQDGEKFSQRRLRTVEHRFDIYHQLFERIITLRHDGQNKLTLEACRHILKWAALMGDDSLASRVFEDAMKKDEIEPDLQCYNYYMEAMNWSHAYSRKTKFSFRVLPTPMRLRTIRLRPEKYSGFRTANPATGSVGIRAEILQSFRQMCELGHTADELTFVNLMVAMGHEGDVDGVLSVLKSVWNIDVKMLEKFDEDELESPTFYEEGSPLRPSEHLLFALAHIFGCNSDARTAWLLVDYVSRNYALEIPRNVWTELLEWHMVLSLRRRRHQRKFMAHTGHISFESFDKLFAVMVDEPHNVKPDAAAHYLQLRVGRERRHLDKQVLALRELQANLEQKTSGLRHLTSKVTDYVHRTSTSDLQHLWSSPTFLSLRHKFILATVDFEAHSSMMVHALCQYLLRFNYWAGGRRLSEWERRKLPSLVKEFAPYLPRALLYRTQTGRVCLEDPDWHQPGKKKSHISMYMTVVEVRSLLDTEDHNSLFQGVFKLKELSDRLHRSPFRRLQMNNDEAGEDLDQIMTVSSGVK